MTIGCDCLTGLRPPPARKLCERAVHARAREALDDIRNGFQILASLTLPIGGAHALAALQTNIRDLSKYISQAEESNVIPWLRPLPEEQRRWEELCPVGGTLFRTQVCLAAEEVAGEWVAGRLFISDVGIMFDSGSLGWLRECSDAEALETGLLRWQDIICLEATKVYELSDGEEKHQMWADPEVKLVVGNNRIQFGHGTMEPNSSLYLQLNYPRHVEWLQEVWRLFREAAGVERQHVSLLENDVAENSAAEEAASLKFTGSAQADDSTIRQVDGSPTTSFNRVRFQVDGSENSFEEKFMDAMASSPSRHRSLSGGSQRGRMYSDAFWMAADSLAMGDEIGCAELVHRGRVPDVTLDHLQTVLELDNGPIHQFLSESLKAKNIRSAPWVKGKRMSSSYVRRIRFSMPVRSDVPTAVQYLVSLPSSTAVTALFRLWVKDDSIVILQQTCTHGVPFGECFRVHDTLRFSPNAENGFDFSKHTEVVWVQPVGWAYSAIKSFVESNTLEASRASGQDFLRILSTYITEDALKVYADKAAHQARQPEQGTRNNFRGRRYRLGDLLQSALVQVQDVSAHHRPSLQEPGDQSCIIQ